MREYSHEPPLPRARITVRYAETDQMGVAYYANYLVWMEVGRAEYCRSVGFRYRDMETEEEVMAVPGSVRGDYIERIQERIAFYKRELGVVGIDYCLLDTSQPLEHGLMAYLMTRHRAI
jgi:hypothetical protein